MGDPEVRAKRSTSRKRNYLAKVMFERTRSIKKVHDSDKDKQKQKNWRLEDDPDGDYDNLDNWLMGVHEER